MTVTAQARSQGRHINWPGVRAYLFKTWPLYVMLLPALVQLALFHYYPMYGVVIAFQKFNPGLGFIKSPWVGLYNFQRLFLKPDFKGIVWNSFFIAISKIITLQLCADPCSLNERSRPLSICRTFYRGWCSAASCSTCWAATGCLTP